MAADVTATSHKEKKVPKKLAHIEIHEAQNGGHIIKHIHTHYEHPPEDHVFGAGESGQAHAHIASQMNMPMESAVEGSGEVE